MLHIATRVFVVLAFVTVTIFATGPPRAEAQSITLVSEDFESAWPGNWAVSDQEPFGGTDHWGVSSYRALGGTRSAWAGEVGANSVYGQPNNVVQSYDNGMNAWLERPFANPGNVEAIRLTFSFWQSSEPCCDPFYVAQLDGFWNTIYWNYGSSGGWQAVSLILSPTATAFAFIFVTDGSVVYEGVYVDDVELVAESGPPETIVRPLAAYTPWWDFSIQVDAWDNGSGVNYVKLYVRFASGPWTLFAPSWNPSGEWPPWGGIPFNASANGDGFYEFYTIGTDYAGNVEAAPTTPDASTTIDTIAPRSSVVGLPAFTNGRALSVEVSATDAGGIALVDVYLRRDLGEWLWIGHLTAAPWSLELIAPTDGLYEFSSTAVDRAGHQETEVFVRDTWVMVDTASPELEIATPRTDGRYAENDVLVLWSGSDTGSGIARYEVRVDGGAWQDHGTATELTLQLADGRHVILIRAYDRAGNTRLQVADITVEASAQNASGPLGGVPTNAVILLLVIALLLTLVYAWRLRGARKDTPPPPAAPPPPVP